MQPPEMIEIPAGEFFMGAPLVEAGSLETEMPPHLVQVPAFALGKYPVTFDEFDLFCEATGQPLPNDEGWGQGRRPVINISWYDAIAYCLWLSDLTGQFYRLPTEAEWEYACRAGTHTRYCFGDDESLLGDYAWFQDNANGMTHPVGEKLPNPWGLYDLHGNVYEWIQDTWHYYYEGLPTDGSAWEGDEDDARVVRGGSWFHWSHPARASARGWQTPHGRSNALGFRLARSS